jgi:hypothetical protein
MLKIEFAGDFQAEMLSGFENQTENGNFGHKKETSIL